MKTIKLFTLSFMFVLLFSIGSYAQCVIVNNSFETWQTDTIETMFGDSIYYENPTPWLSFVDLFGSLFGSASTFKPMVNKTTDKYTGTYAVRVDASGGNGSDFEYFGDCSARPKSLSGYFKFNGTSIDTFMIAVYMVTEDPLGFLFADDTSLAVGSGVFNFTGSQSSYQKFSLSINYKSATTADTFIIFVGNRNNDSLSPLTSLFLDDLSFSNVNDIQEIASFTDTKIYPNPTHGTVNIVSNSKKMGAYLEMYDYTGKQVYSTTINLLENTTISFNFREQNLLPGIYFLRINKGKDVFSTKLIIH